MHGDPYDLANWERHLVKSAFNTLLNADTRQCALRSIVGVASVMLTLRTPVALTSAG